MRNLRASEKPQLILSEKQTPTLEKSSHASTSGKKAT
jgi:hypothetical protein